MTDQDDSSNILEGNLSQSSPDMYYFTNVKCICNCDIYGFVCVYVCMYICIYFTNVKCICSCDIYMYVCVYVCVCVCVCVCIKG